MQDKAHPKTFAPGWQHSSAWGAALLAIYITIIILPMILALVLRSNGDSFLRELSVGCALVLFPTLVLQMVLTARLKTVERPFGQDVLIFLHRQMGIFAGILGIAHPALIMINARSVGILSSTSLRVQMGIASFIILISFAIFALIYQRLRVDYNQWRFTHKYISLAVLFGYIHAVIIGHDMHIFAVATYWRILLVVAIFAFLYRTAFVSFFRRRFIVTDVVQESPDTFTIALRPDDTKAEEFRFLPGQFWFVSLIRGGKPQEEHPYTISSPPTRIGLTSTIKMSGDYTNTIGATKPGDEAIIEGPFGRFSHLLDSPAPMLLIAGGVGITPMMSMLRHIKDTGDQREIVLLFGNKKEEDILFRDELAQMKNVKATHVLNFPPDGWTDAAGFITEEMISEKAGEILAEAHVYVCGPPLMMEKVIEYLLHLGVKQSRIHYEQFSF